MWFLARIATELTRYPREKVSVTWSNTMWIPNLFRLWELIFWRRAGVRRETTSYLNDGKETLFIHSWEAFFFVIELKIREFLSRRLVPFRLYIPMFSTPEGIRFPVSPYLFAIAIQDVGGTIANGGSKTITSGTNLVAVAFWFSLTGGTPTMTCGGVSMTQIGSGQAFAVGELLSMFVKAAPATGTVTFTGSGATDNRGLVVGSFTGVHQTFPVDNSNASFASTSSVASSTVSTTTPAVVASSCWLIGTYTLVGGNATFSAYSGDFSHRSPTSDQPLLDSGGTVGTGARSGGLTFTNTTSSAGLFIAALQPPSTVTKFLPIMGVGT